MLEISEHFLTEEIRDGYLISEMMKRSWAAQLSILDSLKKLFDKYGLRYFADYGSLLGAVRHQGYVPWDDDLDISMPRKDFMILLEHADEIDEGLLVRSVYNSETYTNFNAVVTHRADTLRWDEERTEKYYGCPFICYVDIFPWDYVPRDEEECRKQRQMYTLAYGLIYDLMHIEMGLNGGKTMTLNELRVPALRKYLKVQEFLGNIVRLEKLMARNLGGNTSFKPGRKLRQQICVATDRIAQMCQEKDADWVEYFPALSGQGMTPPRRRKEWQETTVELPFEFTSIMVPREYKKIVVSKYGENYARPVRFTSAHGYPFFRDEIRVLIGGDTGEMLADEPNQDPSVEAIPEEIRQFLLLEDGSLKRIILYGLSATDIVNNGKKSLEQIMAFLNGETRREDTVIFVFVPAALKGFMEKCHLEMTLDYCNMLEQIGEMDGVILDDDPDTGMLWTLISICDEYYGDKCRLEEICRKYEVPVTIQDYQPQS